LSAHAAAGAPSPGAGVVPLLAGGAVAFGVFLSGFVNTEPAPYELFMVGVIAVWALFGLRVSRYPALLLALLVAYNIGGMISMTQMATIGDTPIHLGVTLFLSLTAVFFAAATQADPGLFRLVFRAWTAAAIVTGLLGIGGYFSLFPGSEAFTLYDRATGAFKDPNVFGPYLALPAIYMLYRLMTGPATRLPLYAGALLVIVLAMFVSFSRGTWGMFAASSAVMVGALFLQSTSGRFRLRIAMMSLMALLLLVLCVLAALQLPGVADFLTMRAQIQDYDSGHLGRFARIAIGFEMAMSHPLGIGPLVFGTIYGEDPHNIWLKALVDYSWLGFAALFTLVVWTIAAGFRLLFRDRPWQPYLLCAWCVFVGHIVLGTVIDMDHWRHFYMLIGLIWGCLALEEAHQRRLAALARPRLAA
jgi:hypothetical protein